MAELEEGYILYRGLDVHVPSESDEVEATELVGASDSEAEDDFVEVEPEVARNSDLPAPAAIAKKRSLPVNKSRMQPPNADIGEEAKKATCITNAVKLSEFENQYLGRHDGQLFCPACRQFISEKKSSVETHFATKKYLMQFEHC